VAGRAGLRQKKCKSCGKGFQAANSLVKVCSLQCALKIGRKKAKEAKSKEYNKRTRDLKKEHRDQDRSWWLKSAQNAFNAYVRERDRLEPCISCGRNHEGQWHAGHYRTVGAHPEVRFHPFNNNKQCAPCNNHKSGDIVNYRINLKDKIGEKSLVWLEGYHEPCKWTIEDLKEIKLHYTEQLKLIKSKDSFERWAEGL
jgi:hypothetical protein